MLFPLSAFSLIARCLQKVQMESAEGFMIVPIWPTQSWHPKLLHMLVDVPRVLLSQRTALQMPGPDETRSSPLNQENGSDCLQIVRQSYETQGFSQKATSTVLEERKPLSSTPPTSKDGLHHYCHQKQIDPVSATVLQVLDILVELFEAGVGYSGINTVRSTLSSVLKAVDQITFGTQESVKRFLEGVYEARPSNPRHAVTWHVNMACSGLS